MHSMRYSIFSEALNQHSNRGCCKQVSPKELNDTLVNEDATPEVGEDSEEEEPGSRVIKSQKILYQPSAQEWDDHQRTHIPFRKWCPHCGQTRWVAESSSSR